MIYRLNVAAILRNLQGRILICERLNVPGAWQFPQGGVDREESHERALGRELFEEIGVRPEQYRIVIRKGPYTYLFGGDQIKKGYHGKEQHYFLCDFSGLDTGINVAMPHPEFRAYRWIRPSDFELAWLPENKREVYREVLNDFFDIKL